MPQKDRKHLLARLSGLKSVYPFNEYEYRLMFLLNKKVEKMLYWILTNKEVKKHPIRSHQHRGGIEYQIGITDKNIADFKKFLVEPSRLVKAIKAKAGKK